MSEINESVCEGTRDWIEQVNKIIYFVHQASIDLLNYLITLQNVLKEVELNKEDSHKI